ncbi:S41 family peptidase [Butyrivibrio sp. XPD2002]|uniref:S41 family peptidase n=1 Tax=Butyrivibrio sp. XPD2002 TaxID=1280665 RepID=UPI00047AE5A6|nr:S41 family peptidase [Butyrivibrio sp. XPD2002]
MTKNTVRLIPIFALCAFVSMSCGSSPAVRDTPKAENPVRVEADRDTVSDTAQDGSADLHTTTPLSEDKESKSEAKPATDYKVTYKEFPLYLGSSFNPDRINLAFFDHMPSVPYISMAETEYLLEYIYHSTYYPTYELELSEYGSVSTLTRENEYTMEVDSDKDTITYLDYDAFILPPDSIRLIDIMKRNDFNPDGTTNYFQHTDYAYERYGNEITLSLSDYNIDIIGTEEGCFVPLATISDFLCVDNYFSLLFNGESVIILGYDEIINPRGRLYDLGKVYYSAPAGSIPEDLVKFSYNELCLALDNLYGLKDLHGISTFENFFDNTGLKADLLSTDPATVDGAIQELLNVHLDDLHSAYVAPSYYKGYDPDNVPPEGSSTVSFEEFQTRLSDIRDSYYDEVPFYEEIGDTAYITFDKFITTTQDYYKNPPDSNFSDTIGGMLYSYQQITRKGSPVKNVVLDLSLNTGGDVDAAAYVIGMFLGEGQYSLRNLFTDAMTTDYYYVDSDLNHEYDEKDSLSGYKLYCLISPVSFSCGNLVPCIFKSSHKVTLLGQTSGGGTCCVLHMSTATGSVFQLSGHYQLSFVKNGVFYDIDKGTDPDYVISNLNNFYDRQKLTNYIHGLY